MHLKKIKKQHLHIFAYVSRKKVKWKTDLCAVAPASTPAPSQGLLLQS
jgi:hypothetical protein